RGLRAARLMGPPPTAASGAPPGHLTGGHIEPTDTGPRSSQPMNINFGLFPPRARAPAAPADGSRLRGNAKVAAKKRALCTRALHDLENWLAGRLPAAAE